ncbi:heavy metal translocating P-type ATPase [Nonomuraea angiospora]|uniref:heavy metal translocating P-type ATPase n=1 Tax=Nonomuraea angiospora TaxID=46172 RepID=UPI0029CA0B4B|nr:heavy metal translocating P-type ATPase [Nonomuraea angiospora]
MTIDLTTPEAAAVRPAPASRPLRWWRSGAGSLPEVRWALAATALFAVGGLAQLAGAPAWLWWALYLTCYAAGGWEPGLAGLKALREKTLDVDLLMVAAAIGAAAIGQVFDGALLIVIFATSGALEAVATKRTEDSVRGLLDLTPDQATRVDTNGEEEVVAAAGLRVGDVIVVRPGERIGADGRVVDGVSDVDQASITGESLPADKQSGDEVFAGTMNGTGALRVQVTRPAGETVIARIVAMVEQAGATKARTQLFIEKVEQRYSIVMVAATLALFALPLLWGTSVQDSLLRAMTFMIVASPCAVVLATMPPLLAAVATAGRNGVLVKSAVVMERLADVDRVAFDKTGTLTEGRPHLTCLRVLPGTAATARGGSEGGAGAQADRLLALAAAAEQGSEHPLGRAIVAAAHHQRLPLPAAADFAALPGRGVRARVDGRLVELGSPAHLLDQSADGATSGDAGQARQFVAEIEEDGHSAVLLLLDGRPVAVLGLADRMRAGAAQVVAQLTRLTGAAPVLLTGDNPRAAARVAAQAGITDVRAGLLPQDKVEAVHELRRQGARPALVGDGVNDAPALAGAHAGIAMGGSGADLTLQAADAVITRDDLATVPAVLALARRARRLVVANLAIAGTFIAVLVAWDLFGELPLPLGVAGHEGSTVIVGLNGLRLLRDAAWKRVPLER